MAMVIPSEQSPVDSSASLDTPRPGARLALGLLLGVNLFNYIDRYVLAAVEPEIAKFLQEGAAAHGKSLSESELLAATGSLQTAFLISYMVAAPLFGWLADRMSRWILVGISVALWSLASGGTGLAATFGILWTTRIFVGVGEAGYGPAAPTIISDLYPVKRRGAVLAWFYMAIPVGSAIGYMFGGMFTAGGLLSHFHGWRGAFYCVVFPGLLLAGLCFMMKDPPRGQADAGHPQARKASLKDYLIMFKTPSYLLDTAGMAAMTFAIGGISFWMPRYLRDQHAGSLEHVNLVFGILTCFAGISATLLGGIAGDKLRKRYSGSYFIVSAVGIFLSVLFIVLMLHTPFNTGFPFAWVWIFLALFWLFFNTGPANTILANVVHPSMRATAFAMNIFFIHALGDAPSPPLLGALKGRWGWNATFYLVCGMMVLGGILWLVGAHFLARDTELAPRRLDPQPAPVPSEV